VVNFELEPVVFQNTTNHRASIKMAEPATSVESQESGLILLVDDDDQRISYLRNVLEFIHHGLQVVSDFAELKKVFNARGDEVSAVMMGSAISDSAAGPITEFLSEVTPKVALFRVLGTAEKSEDKTNGGPFLGIVPVPCRYEIMLNALHRAQLYKESGKVDNGPQRALELFRSLSGNSRATRRINRMIEQVADTEATVLILGESGTGKEVVARKLHYHSSRRGSPFVPVNCGAIPSELLESELFGHEKGAFTGAISSRQGRFEMAEGGTLFLDEIGDMSLPMQVKILRVLQERTFERVGSNKTIECNVRIIAATHRDLEQQIEKERFREDLYYRLNVFPIEMPPLRDRIEDIPILVTDLIARIEKEKRGSVRLTPAAVSALTQYPWPGNVRELANLIERLAILYPYGVVDIAELPEKFREGIPVPAESAGLPEVTVPGEEPGSVESAPRLPHDGLDLKAHLSNMELSLIRQALDESDGVVAHAAKRLKMRRTTLVEKLRKYGLQRTTESTGI
jgi:sigma-54 specific flagellar transcriptional regulator A